MFVCAALDGRFSTLHLHFEVQICEPLNCIHKLWAILGDDGCMASSKANEVLLISKSPLLANDEIDCKFCKNINYIRGCISIKHGNRFSVEIGSAIGSGITCNGT